MASDLNEPAQDGSRIRIVQPARTEAQIVRNAEEDASREEVTAGISSCVVHLCGCR